MSNDSTLTDDNASGLSFGDLAGLTMSSVDETFFPDSKSVECLSILKACLGTGLTSRAHKLFTELRHQAAAKAKERSELRRRLAQGAITEQDWHYDFAHLNESAKSPLQVWIYNSMLQAYMRKAYQAESLDGTVEWLNRSWELWTDMKQSATATPDTLPNLTDPAPNAASFATMLRGVVALERSGRYPSNAPPLETLIRAVKSSTFDFDIILTSSAFNSDAVTEPEVQGPFGSSSLDKSTEGEVDAHTVLRSLHFAATGMGEDAIVNELDSVQSVLDGRKTLADLKTDTAEDVSLLDLPELLPVKSRAKTTQTVADPASSEAEIPFNLSNLKDNLSVVQEARRTIKDPYERQKWLEHSALESARRRLQHSVEMLEVAGQQRTGVLARPLLQTWMWTWYNKLQETLVEDIERIRKGDVTRHSRGNVEEAILPFLRLLPPSKLALITVLELMRTSGNGGVSDGMKTTRALLQIGRAIEVEFQSEVIQKNPHLFHHAQAVQALIRKRGLISSATREELKEMQAKLEEEGVMSSVPKWTQHTRARVGAYLVQKLMEVALVHRKATDRDGVEWEEDQPAFYSAYQYVGGKKLGVIKLNEEVARRLDKDSIQETLHPRFLPMVVPPKPWTTHDAGGYYSARQSAMRFKDSAEQGSYLRAASDNGDLDTVLAGLDVLGSTSWKINRPIFNVMTEVWNSGEDLADMPPLEVMQPEPQKPDNYDHDLRARSVYLQRIKQWNQQRAANHSQRCDVNYKLEIARAFLGERFYFPHNMDFRGRAYPMPPHLNHIGNDLCRGLLTFADTKPLGAVGLRWLRIHVSNVFGYDKASFAEREQHAIDVEAEIRDSAERPLDGNRWWLKADEPWQCLAACMELTAALKHPEGPEAYESNLPIHQDGTCNGLQHYAALGGDLVGAKQVNLSQGDRPADVYSAVADLVIDQLERDAVNGLPLATILQGKVTRKVVKQTVMTTVYGVTFIGAKNQVQRQLADRGDVAAEDLFRAASYLAKIIMSCIGNLFSGAQDIQDWLSASAKLIARSIPPQRIEEAMRPGSSTKGRRKQDSSSSTSAGRMVKEQMTSVIWTTALGLPVVQPYRKAKKRQIATSMRTVYIQDPLSSNEVSPGKQATAFPPNFIHSLDATHMILTALECHAAGLTFASVHDSYWTHASDIETMSDMIRETFIRLHTQDILQRLREEFLQRYAGYKVPVVALKRYLPKLSGQSDVVHVLPEDEVAQLKGETGEVFLPPAESSEDDEDLSGDSPEGQEIDSLADVDPVDGVVEGQDIETAEAARPKQTKKQPKSQAKTKNQKEEQFRAKYVDLADLLPPIPAKGSFDVNEIKRSLYFFS